MSQVLYTTTNTPRGSLAAAAHITDEEIRERHLKHIAEITKNLAPPQSEELNYEQEEWLKFRMVLYRPFPEPYRVRAERIRQRLREGRGKED